MKTLDAFDFSIIPGLNKPKILDLVRNEFIRLKENVVCLGGSGTSKTHIAIAIGLAAIEAGYRVRFIQAITLAQGASIGPAGIQTAQVFEVLACR